MAEKKRAQNVIDDHYTAWNESTLVFLDMSCGSGKTTFILNTYAPYLQQQGKKMLYLCNRKPLFQALSEKIRALGLDNVIKLMTYQALETKYLMQYREDELEVFDVFVADECHYFLSDALFNPNTEQSYEFLMNQSQKIVILMSATIKYIHQYVLEDMERRQQERIKSNDTKSGNELMLDFDRTFYFQIKADYNHIESIYWYTDREYLFDILSDLLSRTKDTDDKIVYFCSQKATMSEIRDMFSDTSYSKDILYLASNTSSAKFINKGKLYNENGSYSFKERLLVVTKKYDNGVDLIDKNIKYVICDIADLESAIQSIGRKRIIDDDDRIRELYIMNYDADSIKRIFKLTEKSYMELLMYKTDYDQWRMLHGRDRQYQHDCLYRDEYGRTQINKLAEKQLKISYNMYYEIVNRSTDFRNEFYTYSDAFRLVQSYMYDLLMEQKKYDDSEELSDFIDSSIDIKLYDPQIKRLKELCEINMPKDSLNRGRRGKKAIATYIYEKYGVNLKTGRDYSNEKNGATYWLLTK